MMPKQKITISLDTEIAEKLRLQSIKKYGNSRSMSRYIEDLATGAAEAEQPETCSILGHRSEHSFKAEADFNNAVEKITASLNDVNRELHSAYSADWYFALKEACELQLNAVADYVNQCPSCKGLNGPLSKYPDASRNFEIFAMMNSDLR